MSTSLDRGDSGLLASGVAKKKLKPKPPPAVAVQGLGAFERGRYVKARAELEAVASDLDRPEGERKLAVDLLQATKIEPGALWTALACLALFGLVVLVTILKQPG